MKGELVIKNDKITVTFRSSVSEAMLREIGFIIDKDGYLRFRNGVLCTDLATNEKINMNNYILVTIKVAKDAYRYFPILNSDESIRYVLAELRMGPYKE